MFKLARRGLQAAPGRGHARRDRDGPVLPPGIRRHVPRPARAEHALPEGLQADPRLGRLLARRRQERAAAAHLRHRLGRQEAARRLHPAASRKPRSATTARSASELDLFHLQEEAPGLVFWHPKGWTIWQVVEQYMREVYRDNGYQEVRCPQILDVRCGRSPATGTTTTRTCSSPRSEKRDLRAQADELPGPRPDLQPGPAQLPRPADALRRVRPVPPQRAVGRAARHHARARLHPGRRPHLLHRGHDPRASASPSTALLQKVYRDFGFDDVQLQDRDAARQRASATTRSGTRPSRRCCEACARSGVRLRQSLPGEGAFYGPKIEYT